MRERRRAAPHVVFAARLVAAIAAAAAVAGERPAQPAQPAAAPVTQAVNSRRPLLAVPGVTAPGGQAVNVLVREGDSPDVLAEMVCAKLGSMGANPCDEEGLRALSASIVGLVADLANLTRGEAALGRVNFGWELFMRHGQPLEARLHFLQAVNEFPTSPTLLRELAAFLAVLPLQLGGLLTTGGARGGLVQGPNGTWSYVRPAGPFEDAEYLEAWEAHAALRHHPPAAELALLAEGGRPSLLVQRDLFELAASWTDQMRFRPPPPRKHVTEHRIRHDFELLQLLSERGLIDAATATAATAAYRKVFSDAPRSQEGVLDMSEEHWALIRPYYSRRLYVHPCPSLPVPAVNMGAPRAVWRSDANIDMDVAGRPQPPDVGGALSDGGVLVVDNVLSDPALQSLREFAELSTIWFKEYATYLGAMMWSGFATPLLAQIAAELRAAFPEELCDLMLQYVWAFKYDDGENAGIDTHADDAAVNVNIWLTPDDDNMDSDSGGLVIYDASVLGTNLTASEYNDPQSDGAARRRLIEAHGGAHVTVPHRQNRAVLFPSSRLHHTQPFSFRPGIRSRRINLTFLFGHKGLFCPARQQVSFVLQRPGGATGAAA